MTTDKLLFLGLPTREQVRQQLATTIAPDVLQRMTWIRVAQQLRTVERGTKLYMLPGGDELLTLEGHRELDHMIAFRGVDRCEVTPAALAQLLSSGAD